MQIIDAFYEELEASIKVKRPDWIFERDGDAEHRLLNIKAGEDCWDTYGYDITMQDDVMEFWVPKDEPLLWEWQGKNISETAGFVIEQVELMEKFSSTFPVDTVVYCDRCGKEEAHYLVPAKGKTPVETARALLEANEGWKTSEEIDVCADCGELPETVERDIFIGCDWCDTAVKKHYTVPVTTSALKMAVAELEPQGWNYEPREKSWACPKCLDGAEEA